MRNTIISIFTTIFFITALQPIAAQNNMNNEQVIFSEDWESGTIDTAEWVTYGSPLPKIVNSFKGYSNVFDNNGDGWYGSGALTVNPIRLPSGEVTISADIYVDFSNLGGCWADARIGVTEASNPTILNEGFSGGYAIYLQLSAVGDACWAAPANQRRKAWFGGGMRDATGNWEGISGGTIDGSNYVNGWHKLSIVIDASNRVSFYVDKTLLWQSTGTLNPNVRSGKKLVLGDRSSGSAGKAYIDNIEIRSGSSGGSTPSNETTNNGKQTEATTGPTVSIIPTSVASPATGQKLEFSLNITGGKAVAGYQASVQFDTTALRFVSGANGTYLPADSFFVKPKVEGNFVRLNAASLAGEINGDGILTTLTFEVIAVKASTLTLSDVLLSDSAGVTFAPHVENAEITVSDTPTPEATTDATVSIIPTSVTSPAIGQKLEFSLNITGGKAVAGYQASVQFDTTALRFVSGENGTYLPAGAFFVPPKVEGNLVRLNAASLAGEINGDGILTTLTFEVIAVKASTLTLSDVLLSDSAGVTFAPHVENAEITASDTSTPETTTDATVSIIPTSVASPAIGQKLEFSLKITGGKAVAGYQASVQFDTTALRFVSGENGTYLPAGAFFVPPKVEGNLVRLNAASLAGEINGNGTLTTLTFEVLAVKASTLTLSDVLLSNSAGVTFAPHVENAKITASDTPTLAPQLLSTLTAADVEQWLSQAQQLNLMDDTSLQGIQFLEQLLAVLTPKQTALLPNYPNPFNPETWVPYQLAKPADVTLTIYDINGRVVRALNLGHQQAGMYHSRTRAAHWDGRNALGEKVASGVYFYVLKAGDFSATRKMLIRK